MKVLVVAYSLFTHFLLQIISKCLHSILIKGKKSLIKTMVLCFCIQVMVPGNENNLLLQSLLPNTEYKVTVTPIYNDEEGVSVSAPGKTCEWSFVAGGSVLFPYNAPLKAKQYFRGKKRKQFEDRASLFAFSLHTSSKKLAKCSRLYDLVYKNESIIINKQLHVTASFTLQVLLIFQNVSYLSSLLPLLQTASSQSKFNSHRN